MKAAFLVAVSAAVLASPVLAQPAVQSPTGNLGPSLFLSKYRHCGAGANPAGRQES